MFESDVTEQRLEPQLVELERRIDEVAKSVTQTNIQVKKAKRAVGVGAMRDLEVAIGNIASLAETLSEECLDLKSSSEIDVHSWIDSGGYTKELLELAREHNLTIIESDHKLLCYPSILQISATEPAILLDKVKDRGIRPTHVIKKLKNRSQTRVKFKAESFLASLRSAYDLHIARSQRHPGSTVKLVELYEILTLLPGSKSYSKAEFTKDIYLLDQSGEVTAKDGRILRFASSATTRGSGLLETVAMGGQVKLYSAVSFEVQS